jgi:hypothetical protein
MEEKSGECGAVLTRLTRLERINKMRLKEEVPHEI